MATGLKYQPPKLMPAVQFEWKRMEIRYPFMHTASVYPSLMDSEDSSTTGSVAESFVCSPCIRTAPGDDASLS